MKILITGANGYLGSLLCEYISQQNEIIPTSHSSIKNFIKMDITNLNNINCVLKFYSPHVIIHNAAISNIKKCEVDKKLAFLTNVIGTKNIVTSANNIGASVIFISSLASQNNKLVYGKTKSMAEYYVRRSIYGYEILQLSMLFGLSPNTTNHRPFNKILYNYINKIAYTYDNYWKFQPTYTLHLVNIIIDILRYKLLNRTLPIVVDKSCTMYEIAKDIIGKDIVNEGKIYNNRDDVYIDNNILKYNNLKTMSYNDMIKHIRLEFEIQ